MNPLLQHNAFLTRRQFTSRCARSMAALLVLGLICPMVAAGAAKLHEVMESFIAQAVSSNKRNTEGDLVVLKDGSLLVAWSDFYGGAGDNAAARISAAKSRDGGRTWEPRFTLQENVGSNNVMSVSLLRLPSGDILLFFLRKNSVRDLKVYVRRSADEGKTWSEPVVVTPEAGYHVMNNARAIRLASGRIVCPVSTSKQVWTKNDNFRAVMYFSDDDGRTWKRGRVELDCPKRGAMEPGLVELTDGRLLQIIRTQTGYLWESISSDGGDTWTDAKPTTIEAPEAPSTIARIPGTSELLLVWNPKVAWGDPEKTVVGVNHGGPRTPLAAAISRDEGRTWSPPKLIESDPNVTYAYTSITFHDGRALLTYYWFPLKSSDLSLKFKSIPLQWFRE